MKPINFDKSYRKYEVPIKVYAKNWISYGRAHIREDSSLRTNCNHFLSQTMHF